MVAERILSGLAIKVGQAAASRTTSRSSGSTAPPPAPAGCAKARKDASPRPSADSSASAQAATSHTRSAGSAIVGGRNNLTVPVERPGTSAIRLGAAGSKTSTASRASATMRESSGRVRAAHGQQARSFGSTAPLEQPAAARASSSTRMEATLKPEDLASNRSSRAGSKASVEQVHEAAAPSAPARGRTRRPSDARSPSKLAPSQPSAPVRGGERKDSKRRASHSVPPEPSEPWLDRGTVTAERVFKDVRELAVLERVITQGNLHPRRGGSSSDTMKPMEKFQKGSQTVAKRNLCMAETIAQAQQGLAEHRSELFCKYKRLGPELALAIYRWISNKSNNNSTKVFDLSKNAFGRQGAQAVEKILSCGQPVTRLTLEDNDFDETAGEALAAGLRASRSLRELNLKGNPLGTEGAKAIAEAIRVNTSLQSLDLSETEIGAEGGLELAAALRCSTLRRIEVSGNSLPPPVAAAIEASLSFQPDIWSGKAPLEVALRKAQRLNPSSTIPSEMTNGFLGAVAKFWPRQDKPEQMADIVAALHAPLVVTERQVPRGTMLKREDSQSNMIIIEYDTDRLSQLCRIYLPLSERMQTKTSQRQQASSRLTGGWESVRMPEEAHAGQFSANGLLILNLTPFDITVDGCHQIGFRAVMRLEKWKQDLPSDQAERAKVVLKLTAELDCSKLAGGRQREVKVEQKIGERRYHLGDSGDQHGGGTLRVMYSAKDYPGSAMAHMATLVWEPPPEMRGVFLDELQSKWRAMLQDAKTTDMQLPRLVSLQGHTSAGKAGKFLSTPIDQLDKVTSEDEPSRDTRFEIVECGGSRVRLRPYNGERNKYVAVSKETNAVCLVPGDKKDNNMCMYFDRGTSTDGSYTFISSTGKKILAMMEDGSVLALPHAEGKAPASCARFVVSGPNMYEVVDHWLKPQTAAPQCSFASLCNYGLPNTFVSHFWGHPFEHMLNSASKLHEGGEQSRLWICSFANDQRRVSEELGSSLDDSAFKKALCSFDVKSMALMFGEDGAPLKRAWCLYEILQAEVHDIPVDICTPSGVMSTKEGCRIQVEIGINIMATCTTIDVSTAKCTDEKDDKMIRAAIDDFGGTEKMNSRIQAKFKKGVEAARQAQDEEMEKVFADTKIREEDDDLSPWSPTTSSPPTRTRGRQSDREPAFQWTPRLMEKPFEDEEKEYMRKKILELTAKLESVERDSQKFAIENRNLKAQNKELAKKNAQLLRG